MLDEIRGMSYPDFGSDSVWLRIVPTLSLRTRDRVASTKTSFGLAFALVEAARFWAGSFFFCLAAAILMQANNEPSLPESLQTREGEEPAYPGIFFRHRGRAATGSYFPPVSKGMR